MKSVVSHGNNFVLYHYIIEELLNKLKQVSVKTGCHYFMIFWLLEHRLERA